ncbi:MAG: type II toxin-antitoxin system VapC family toxin [Myxococcota bacterium]
MWLLDTNICIYLIKGKPQLLLNRLREVDINTIAVSSITVAELQYGVAKSARPEQNALALAAFLAPLGVEVFDDAAAAVYGPIRAELERAGKPIGSLDMLIAAHALALGRTVVTNNAREFDRVAGLKVENWAE